jgi:LysM repeat protein
MNFRRLLLYLLLNALVSASATYAVLWYWDQQHPAGIGVLPASTAVAATQAALSLNSVPEATAAPTLTLPPAGETAAAGPTPTIYVAKAGDTLGKIAQAYDVTVEAIMEANGLTDANLLTVGQSLVIPVAGYVPPTATPGAEPAVPATSAAEPPRPTVTSAPNQPAAQLSIVEVRKAGTLADEVVVLRNDGGQVALAGWTLRDETGSSYVFPALTLAAGSTVNLHTAAGSDSAEDLYWGQAQAVWATGHSVLLSDAAGNLHTRFTIP